jgi:hypothetical protein
MRALLVLTALLSREWWPPRCPNVPFTPLQCRFPLLWRIDKDPAFDASQLGRTSPTDPCPAARPSASTFSMEGVEQAHEARAWLYCPFARRPPGAVSQRLHPYVRCNAAADGWELSSSKEPRDSELALLNQDLVRSRWVEEGIVAAYRWPSMIEVFHAHRHSRQKPQPLGLRVASVRRPWQPEHAQIPDLICSSALPLSNMNSESR